MNVDIGYYEIALPYKDRFIVIEAIDVIEALDLNYNLGCVIKYLVRQGRKTNDPLSDLVKAADYLTREIQTQKHRSQENRDGEDKKKQLDQARNRKRRCCRPLQEGDEDREAPDEEGQGRD